MEMIWIFTTLVVIAFIVVLIYIIKGCIRVTTNTESFIGACKEKYTGLEGRANGGSFTKYFLVFEKDNERIVLNCTGEQYGLIKVEDKAQVNYKVINNKEKWLDSYMLI